MSELPGDLAEFVDGEVASGEFASSDAVIQAGLRLLQERHRARNELRALIQKGLDDFENGDFFDLDTPEDVERFKKELIAEAKQELDRRDSAA